MPPQFIHMLSLSLTPFTLFTAFRPLLDAFRHPVVYKRPAKSLWKDTIVIANAQGEQESFSIGTDGFVWSYQVASADHKAGKLRSTGVQATSFTVDTAANGRLVIVAADGLALKTSVENDISLPLSKRWSKPELIAISLGDNALFLEKVFSKTEHGNLFVGATLRCVGENSRMTRQFWHGVWAGNTLICGHRAMLHGYVNEFWFETLCLSGHLDDLTA